MGDTMNNILEIEIDGEKYNVIDSIRIDGKGYLAYAKDDCIYVSEYFNDNGVMNLKQVSQETLRKVLKELDIIYEE